MKFILTLLLLATISVFSKEIKKNEAFYRDQWADANNGETEVTMGDGTRCDIVTKTHAIEVDWAYKWTESIGQSLWYSFQLADKNKKAGIVLILKEEKDKIYLMKLRSIIAYRKLDIEVWAIRIYPH